MSAKRHQPKQAHAQDVGFIHACRRWGKEKTMDKILVVEDDVDIRDMLVETLTRLGYETDTATNGQEGLDSFQPNTYSAVITDIRMPVLDGLSMLKKIKKMDTKVSIIVITGYPSVDSALECLTEGADYYLVKPIKMDDLDTKIKKALEKREIQIRLASLKTKNLILAVLIPIWILSGYLLSRLL